MHALNDTFLSLTQSEECCSYVISSLKEAYDSEGNSIDFTWGSLTHRARTVPVYAQITAGTTHALESSLGSQYLQLGVFISCQYLVEISYKQTKSWKHSEAHDHHGWRSGKNRKMNGQHTDEWIGGICVYIYEQTDYQMNWKDTRVTSLQINTVPSRIKTSVITKCSEWKKMSSRCLKWLLRM